ncbi:hypothetical protein OVY29_05290 [Sphingopyxis sp. SE2]|uniref:hypothetical protein n=1 Tax=Sphingopyxis sp. SE2 TaxID=1586240 RepID=UPI0028C32410|nr:hypothetical protein [Sphingopyxis sp. SE2]MDT7528073.1 hypothetical protein [Sphingopyxis sp. SE2]
MLAMRRPSEMLGLQNPSAFIAFREVITRATRTELARRATARASYSASSSRSAISTKVVRIIHARLAPPLLALLAREWPIGEIAPISASSSRSRAKWAPPIACQSAEWLDLDLRLHRLTALGRDEIGKELGGGVRD